MMAHKVLAAALPWMLFSRCVRGKTLGRQSDVCLQACQNSVVGLSFGNGSEVSASAAQLCLSRLTIQSMYLCLDVYCDPDARAAELKQLNDMCLAAGGSELPPLSIIANYTADDIERLHHVKLYESYPPGFQFTEPVIPSAALHRAWVESLESARYIKHHHFLYGVVILGFWIGVIAIGAVNRMLLALGRALNQTGRYSRSRKSPTRMWWKRKILLPATFGYRSATEIWCGTIPRRIQTMTIAVFVLLNIALTVYGYQFAPVDLLFPSVSRPQHLLHAVSDRVGNLAFSNFPVVWLFGMRNNVALWLTGWDFGTYNSFHRWVARIATLQAVIHSVGYTILVFQRGGWAFFLLLWNHWFWTAGEIATVGMCALMAFSVYWMRRQRYELFLVLHMAMAAIVLFTMFGHVSIFAGGYDLLCWAPVFIWIFDRSLRLLRILFFNPAIKPATATASYNKSTNILRLEIPCRFPLYRVQPGTFCYLSVLSGTKFWESHPFTVATVSESRGTSDRKLPDEQVPLLDGDGMSSAEEREADGMEAERASKVLTFLIRPHDSFTGRMRDLALSHWPRPASVRVLVDGPYGHSLPLHLFDHVVFIVGGSGVAPSLSYLNVLTGMKSRVKTVQLHWAVREPEFAAGVVSTDMATALVDGSFSLDVYFSAESECLIQVAVPSKVSRHYGRRPDVRQIIISAAAKTDGSSLAVVACGPPRMADDARHAVIETMDRGMCDIDYFEESFRW